MLATIALLIITAIAEILGSYLMYLWLRQNYPHWLAIPAVFFLLLFGWLLTLHEGAAARTYAAYGGIYVFSSFIWLWLIEKQQPTLTDALGVGIIIVGAAIILLNR